MSETKRKDTEKFVEEEVRIQIKKDEDEKKDKEEEEEDEKVEAVEEASEVRVAEGVT